jgi:hypothetical protein
MAANVMAVIIKAQLAKDQVWTASYSLDEAGAVTVADVQRAIQQHFQLGTCKVLGWPKVSSASSASSAVASSPSAVASTLRQFLPIKKPIVLRVIGQKQSAEALRSDEAEHHQAKLDRDARQEWDEVNGRKRLQELQQLRDRNLHSRNMAHGHGTYSIAYRQELTLNEYCLTGNYVDGEKHIRLSAALQEVFHKQERALCYAAASGSLALLQRMLEHSARSTTHKKKKLRLSVLATASWQETEDVLGYACKFGHADIVAFVVETHDYLAEWRTIMPPHDPNNILEDEDAVARRDALNNWRAKLSRYTVHAARYCQLRVVQYLLKVLAKIAPLTPAFLSEVAAKAADHGDWWIVRECLTKWKVSREDLDAFMAETYKDKVALHTVPDGVYADPYASLHYSIRCQQQMRVFEYIVGIPGINPRCGGLVKSAALNLNCNVLRYLVQRLGFTAEEMKCATYETVEVAAAAAAQVLPDNASTEDQGSSSSAPSVAPSRKMLVECSITWVVDAYHPGREEEKMKTLECLLSDCRVILSREDSESLQLVAPGRQTQMRHKYLEHLQRAQYAREVKEVKASGIAGALSGRVDDISSLSKTAAGGNMFDVSLDASLMASNNTTSTPTATPASIAATSSASSSSSDLASSSATWYVDRAEYLTYPLDMARLMAHQITGSYGLNSRRFAAEGSAMFGPDWKKAFEVRERKALVERQEQERRRAQAEADRQQRLGFFLPELIVPGLNFSTEEENADMTSQQEE